MRNYLYVAFLLLFYSCSKPGELKVIEFEVNSEWEVINKSRDSIEYILSFNIPQECFYYEYLDLTTVIANTTEKNKIFFNDTIIADSSSPIKIRVPSKKCNKDKPNYIRIIRSSRYKIITPDFASVSVLAWSKARLINTSLNLISLQKEIVQYNAEITFESLIDRNVDIDIMVQQKEVIKIRDLAVKRGINKQMISFSINNPKLWWINGYGVPNLYDINIKLKLDGYVVDEQNQELAIRKFEYADKLSEEKSDKCIRLNDIPFYIKGVRFIPPTQSVSDSIELFYRKFVESVAMSNMNIIYVDNTFFYKSDFFSSLCSKKGLLLIDSTRNLLKSNLTWFGFPSYPSLETMHLCHNSVSENNSLHFDHKQHAGLPLSLSDTIYQYFNPSIDLKRYIYYSQLLQSEKIKSVIEKFRLGHANSCGIIYNQFSDYSTVLSESLQDCMGNWKPANYTLKEAFAPCVVIPVLNKNLLKVFCINDDNKEMDAILLCKIIDFNGNDYFVKQIPIVVKPGFCQEVLSIDLQKSTRSFIRNKSCFVAQLNQPGQMVAQNILYFEKPKKLEIPYARIKASVNVGVRNFNLILKSNELVKNVVLSVVNQGASFSSNNFDILPGKRVKVSVDFKGTRQELVRNLRIEALNSFEIDFK